MTPILVFLGAGIGGVARYGIGRLLPTVSAGIPWATLGVNVSGSLLIGLFAAVAQQKAASPSMQAFLAIGICGGYTTFSAFSLESLTMIQAGHWGRALSYAVASVGLCVLAAFVGLRIGVAVVQNA